MSKILELFMNGKEILTKGNDSFFLCPAKFFEKGTAIHIEIIGKMLPVKGNFKAACIILLKCLSRKIGQNTSTDRLRGGIKDSL